MKNEIYKLSLKNLREFNFAPESEFEEIAQNILTIISTAKGSVPMYREFGISDKLLDYPVQTVKVKLTAEIVAAVAKFEPRAKVTQVTFDGDGVEGKVFPTVWFKIDGKMDRWKD